MTAAEPQALSERAVLVIEFDLPEDGFASMLDDLREWLDDRTPPRAIYGAMRDDAARVLAVFAAPDPALTGGADGGSE